MKEYNVFTMQDFSTMVKSFMHHFSEREEKGLPFPKIKIIAKRWVKSKTSPQHRLYWASIGELKKAFKEAGYVYHQQDIHEFIKREAGFTKMIELPNGKMIMINKSIADNSEDINGKEISMLIEYIKDWSAENLNYIIKTN